MRNDEEFRLQVRMDTTERTVHKFLDRLPLPERRLFFVEIDGVRLIRHGWRSQHRTNAGVKANRLTRLQRRLHPNWFINWDEDEP